MHLPRRGAWSTKSERRLPTRHVHLCETFVSTADQPMSRRERAAAQRERACQAGRSWLKPPTHSDVTHLPRRAL
eukprot:7391296-Prymnesium_polylepis.1